MEKKAKDVMNSRVEWIFEDATVYDAIEKIIDKRIRSLLVVKNEDLSPSGVITIRDIIFKVLYEGLPITKVKVKEIASTPVVTVAPEASVRDVFELMKKYNIARVFVKNQDKIEGVISFFDLLNFFLIEEAKK
ncbi:MAG: CBS domain-containing protein [Thermodesulfobacteria bacterium]|nr:CBS domain-containing protein [Thermodesulfobacteriota bacterium]